MEPLDTAASLLKELRLPGMAIGLKERVRESQKEELGYEGFLNLLLQDEVDFRKNSRIKKLLQRASFKQGATLEQFDFAIQRGVDKKLLKDLSNCSFIKQGVNLVISGPTGVGKSFLATAFGNNACRHGISSIFFRMNTLIEQALLARAKGGYLNFVKRISSYDLLILDDFGIKPLEPQGFQDLYDIIDERCDAKSTIITTQVPVENWSEIISDPVTCEAITDRIVSHAITIPMNGGTYRINRIKN
jgi:DNA replication protein DnaC